MSQLPEKKGYVLCQHCGKHLKPDATENFGLTVKDLKENTGRCRDCYNKYLKCRECGFSFGYPTGKKCESLVDFEGRYLCTKCVKPEKRG